MVTCTCINLAYNGKTTCLPANTQYNTHLDKIHNKEISKTWKNTLKGVLQQKIELQLIRYIIILLVCRLTYNYVQNMATCITTPSSYWKLARKHVKWFISFFCHWQHSTSCVCVETHLDGEGRHSNLDTRTPTFHVQTQMEHNSSPPGGGMEVGLVLENQSQDLLQ